LKNILFIYLAIIISSIPYGPAHSQENPAQKKEKPPYSRPIPETQEAKRFTGFQGQANNQAWIHFKYARELAADGKLSRAVSLYEEFLILYPDHELCFPVMIEMGKILTRQNRKSYAIDLYRKAYQKRKESEEGIKAYLEAGRLLSDLGEIQKAKTVFEEIILNENYTELANIAQNELNSLPLLDL